MGTGGTAQGTGQMVTPETLYDLRFFSDLRFDPTGRHLAYRFHRARRPAGSDQGGSGARAGQDSSRRARTDREEAAQRQGELREAGEEAPYESHIWVMRSDGSTPQQLTAGPGESTLCWLRDGHSLVFASDRTTRDRTLRNEGGRSAEFTQFYVISLSGGEAVPAFRIEKSVRSIWHLEGDRFLLLAEADLAQAELTEAESSEVTPGENVRGGPDSAIRGTGAVSDDDRPAENGGGPDSAGAADSSGAKADDDVVTLEEIPFWSNGRTFTSRRRAHLYLASVAWDGGEPSALVELTPGPIAVSYVDLNPARTRVVFVAAEWEGRKPLTNAVYVAELSGSGGSETAYTRLSDDAERAYDAAVFLNDETVIASGTDMQRHGINENSQFYRMRVASRVAESTANTACITPDLDLSPDNRVNSDCRYGTSSAVPYRVDGQFVYFVATVGERAILHRVDEEGTLERFPLGDYSVDAFDVHSRHVVFLSLMPDRGQELYTVRIPEAGTGAGAADEADGIKRVTDVHAALGTRYRLSRPQRAPFQADDGHTIEGWVLYPPDFESAGSYPGILQVHGGPKTVYGELLFHEMQCLAAAGYIVFYCNPRGSDGHGNAFADIRGAYGSRDFQDLRQFTDHVLSTVPALDAERLGVAGGSYGGFMTNWIITHSDRFAAACSQRGIANWVSFWGTSDIGYFFADDQIGANPWTSTERMWEMSPLAHAEGCRTPTLFIHAGDDYRCWTPESYQMFTALRYHDVEARLVLFPGENHELSRSGKPRHRVRRLRELIGWFDRHLKSKR